MVLKSYGGPKKMGYQTGLLSFVAEVCSALWSFVGGLNHIFGSANRLCGIGKLCGWELGPLGHSSGISGNCALGDFESCVKHFGALTMLHISFGLRYV